ncbi:Ig-like domain-containing protein [Bacteroidota bacterium]
MKKLNLEFKKHEFKWLCVAFTAIFMLAGYQTSTLAQVVGPNDRVAYSADGNSVDPDDWSATPIVLAVWADAGFQNRMVHFDYNSRLDISLPRKEKENYESTIGGAKRFKFDLSNFYNDQTQLDASVANLAKEINASSKTSRLWICAAGPFEVVYQGILAADPAKRQYCTIVSHSPMNEKPDKWEGAHGKDHCVALGVEYKSIRTGNGCTNAFGSGKCASWELVDWLKNSTDEDFRWIYNRLRATYAEKNKLDASDCTMAYYLAYNDENGSFTTLHEKIGDCMYQCDNPTPPPPDTDTKATVSITSPANGVNIPSTKDVTVTVDASDDSGIEKVHLFLGNNGWDFKGADLEIPYEWNLGKLPVGSYDIKVAAISNSGEKVTTSISFEIH